ncbi:Capsular polysaccharide type 8 biosynthesis protein cap8A [Paraliobacillus sp. PM-2]|uniref:YveK family protein n=1 Tax=Paraliobacillus sp. PM-2 TaxID=1462524 RepID=UPI00061CC795|nr:Wzz/FepE/Etk N-terminal domain-containing protein [Paraliobacillus sp. PM-2]CQR46216.1 Capsular polysaccharide type 8 biosynthesis protein cap8A [Paraliobacillus sp. PM-2]
MEETISIKEIMEVLKKRLGLIFLLTIGAALISGLVTYFLLTPTYQSSSQFIVNQKTAETDRVDYNEIRSNVEIINTYNVVIRSPRILDKVIDELDLTLSAGALKNKINVGSEQSSQVVTVTATDPDPATAVAIANKTVEIFQEDIDDLMNVDNVNILSEAELSANPSPVSPKPTLNIAIALVVGAMAGVGLAFLLEYLDNTVKTEQDVEQKLGLPVIGTVSHIKETDVASVQYQSTAIRKRERGNFSG